MTGAEYEAAIGRLGLTQEAAGIFLGTTGRTSRRWIADQAPIPETVSLLLRYMVARGITAGDVAATRDCTVRPLDAVSKAMASLTEEQRQNLLGDGQ